MADISKIKLPNTTEVYNVKDTTARQMIEAISWDNLTGKPFETIGDGLSIVNDALVADGIPTITLTVSQVISQNPIKVQLTNEQADILDGEYGNFVFLDAMALNLGKISLTKTVHSDGRVFYFGFDGGTTGNSSQGFLYHSDSKQVEYLWKHEIISDVDLAEKLADYTTTEDLNGLLADKADVADLADYLKKDGTVAMTGALAMGTHKITGLANGTASTDAVTLGQMGDAIEAVEAKQLYATAAQGSFATKAALTGAATFYNADGTVATPTKNDVAYVLADESHNGKAAKYVIASVNPIVWGFVITFSDVTFTQAQMNAINSGATSAKIGSYDTHVANTALHVPSSTTSDNGKFLRVVNGAAAWATVPAAESTGF